MQYRLLTRVSLSLRNYFSWRSRFNASYRELETNNQVAASCPSRYVHRPDGLTLSSYYSTLIYRDLN